MSREVVVEVVDNCGSICTRCALVHFSNVVLLSQMLLEQVHCSMCAFGAEWTFFTPYFPIFSVICFVGNEIDWFPSFIRAFFTFEISFPSFDFFLGVSSQVVIIE